MKKKRPAIIVSVVFILLVSAYFVTRMNAMPDVDKIDHVQIYNTGTKKKVTLSEEESKKLYNSIEMKRISYGKRVKLNFWIEVTFYSKDNKPLLTLYTAEPYENSSLDQVMVKHVIGRGPYRIDKQFYHLLGQVKEKYNFSFREHLPPSELEQN